MRFSVRAFILILSLSFLASALVPSYTLAQGRTQSPQVTTYPTAAPYNDTYSNSYSGPNTEANVPNNQHTRVQTIIFDVLSATTCMLIGIDPTDKNKACLDINPTTGKIGYAPTKYDENGDRIAGGILGASTHMIGMLYTPTIRTNQYTDYLAQNFGIVKPAYAQGEGYGFNGLDSLLVLWTAVRNMAYFILMLAFIVIGLGVMLRVKIDPRTVMTLQNQIPRIIICILLVTFSYPIAGLAIDTMWLTTYVGINVITSAGPETNPITNIGGTGQGATLAEVATSNLVQTPLTYVDQIFKNQDGFSGIYRITSEVAGSLGEFLKQIIEEFLGVRDGATCSVWTGQGLGACVRDILGGLAAFLLWIIILVTVLKLLFTIWFTLLKAYTFVILYTIGAPFFIVMGLLPGKPLGFEKWLRSLLANLAVFPLTAFVLVLARLFMELFSKEGPDRFIAPLIGQPNISGLLGVLIAFGLLLLTPTLLTQLQEALKVPGNKHGGAAIGGAIAAGAAAPKGLTEAAWKKSVQKGGPHQDPGWLRRIAAGKPPVSDNLVGTENRDGTRNPGRAVNRIRKWRSMLVKYDSDGRRRGGGGH